MLLDWRISARRSRGAGGGAPDGIYHYVLLEEMTERSTIRCLRWRLDKPLPIYQW